MNTIKQKTRNRVRGFLRGRRYHSISSIVKGTNTDFHSVKKIIEELKKEKVLNIIQINSGTRYRIS